MAMRVDSFDAGEKKCKRISIHWPINENNGVEIETYSPGLTEQEIDHAAQKIPTGHCNFDRLDNNQFLRCQQTNQRNEDDGNDRKR